MFRFAVTVLASAFFISHTVSAQPRATVVDGMPSDVIGWTGLATTPVGAFAPVITGRLNAGATRNSFHVRVARQGLELVNSVAVDYQSFNSSNVNFTSVGAGAVLARGRTRTAVDLGFTRADRCAAESCLQTMVGTDVQIDVKQFVGDNATLVVLINPAFGVSMPRQGDAAVLSAGLSIPLSASVNIGSALRLVPFVSPGVAYSRLTGGGSWQSGSQGTVAGGVSVGGQSSPLLLSLTARRIFLEGSPTLYGINMSVAP